MSLKMTSKKENIQILGAYGAKSEKGGSTSFYLNDKNVIDAGNILKALKDKNIHLETIWLTHSHLDHIIDIAYILDNYYEKRLKPLTIYGLPATIKALKKHFFNHIIWPDFTVIPLVNGKGMSIEFKILTLQKRYEIETNVSLRAFKTDHTVPSCGYIISTQYKSLLISSDTYSLESVIEEVNRDETIKTIVIECSFPSKFFQLAHDSKHLTPKLLFEKLQPLERRGIKLYLNHIKPAYEDILEKEIEAMKGEWDTTILKDGKRIEF